MTYEIDTTIWEDDRGFEACPDWWLNFYNYVDPMNNPDEISNTLSRAMEEYHGRIAVNKTNAHYILVFETKEDCDFFKVKWQLKK